MPLLICLLAGRTPPASAQPPLTDVWLAELTIRGDSIAVGPLRNVTHRPGYDNQPCFTGDGSQFLYVAADSSGQTDVFRFDGSSVRRVTSTRESEYSPTPMPAPGRGFLTVRVEADSTQRLWQFDTDGSNPRLVAAKVDSVGYFAWADEATLVVFVVGEPHTLRLVDLATQSETVVARDIGRSILLVPGGRGMSFLARESDGTYRFLLLPLPDRAPVPLIDAVGEGQDAVWIGDHLVMSSGTKLFASRPFDGPDWREVADLAGPGIRALTRVAVSPDRRWIAVVASEPQP